MSEKKYDWLRFWAPRDGKVAVNSYGVTLSADGATLRAFLLDTRLSS
jgi:hypothetical protein